MSISTFLFFLFLWWGTGETSFEKRFLLRKKKKKKHDARHIQRLYMKDLQIYMHRHKF